MSAFVVIEALWIYPVKSLGGIACDAQVLLSTGLKFDRHWMIIRDDGQYVTQRQVPLLAHIRTQLTDDHLLLNSHNTTIKVPLALPTGASRKAQVWDDYCEVIDEGSELGTWLTDVSQSPFPLRLVRMKPGFQRPQSKPERFGGHYTQFADAAPLLITNTASLQALNLQLHQKSIASIGMERFRPNIVISGMAPWEEQQPVDLVHRDYTLTLCDRSSRCIMVSIDQHTGHKDSTQQPLPMLREINPMPDKPVAAFGMNTVVSLNNSSTATMIRCGDRLTVQPRQQD